LPQLVADINAVNAERFSISPNDLTVVGSNVYFTADDKVNGRKVWNRDGSAAGAILIKDIWPGYSGVDGG
jgi:ELWxxDGT repeat protein